MEDSYIRDYQRRWRAEHRGYAKQWGLKHPGYYSKYHKKYRQMHKGFVDRNQKIVVTEKNIEVVTPPAEPADWYRSICIGICAGISTKTLSHELREKFWTEFRERVDHTHHASFPSSEGSLFG